MRDNFIVFTPNFLDVDLFDMDQAQQLLHRARHVATAFVA